MDQMHPMLAKVRKLLAQAESPACTPAEAEAFTAKAAALVAAYGIDEALLAVGDDPARDPVADRVVDVDPPYAREKAVLVAEVAGGLRCRAVLRQRRAWDEQWRPRTEVSVHVFGHRSDLRAVDVLLTSLLLQGTRDMVRTPVPPGEHAAAYRRTWWLGFAGSIGSRLRALERAAAADAEQRFAARGTSAALVLADRAADAEDAMRAAYPGAGTAAQRRLSGGGLASGWSAGQRADLGGPGVGGPARGEIAG
jgi:hypothetical protein